MAPIVPRDLDDKAKAEVDGITATVAYLVVLPTCNGRGLVAAERLFQLASDAAAVWFVGSSAAWTAAALYLTASAALK